MLVGQGESRWSFIAKVPNTRAFKLAIVPELRGPRAVIVVDVSGAVDVVFVVSMHRKFPVRIKNVPLSVLLLTNRCLHICESAIPGAIKVAPIANSLLVTIFITFASIGWNVILKPVGIAIVFSEFEFVLVVVLEGFDHDVCE